MNSAQNPQMGASWHALCTTEDRQKVVHVLATTLKQLMPASYNDPKARSEAEIFEKAAFQRLASREEYMGYIRKKVEQSRARPQTNDVQMPMLSSMGGAKVMNAPQNNYFARDRPQTMPQMRSSAQPGAQPHSALTLQIANMIRTGPIPPQFLAKMPMLPPNVTTWPHVYECMNKKLIPPSAVPVNKEVQAAHIQLVYRQQQQQQMMQLRMNNELQNAASQNLEQHTYANNMGNMNNMGINLGRMGGMGASSSLGNMGVNMGNMGSMARPMAGTGAGAMNSTSQQGQMMLQNYLNKSAPKEQMAGQGMGMGMSQQQQATAKLASSLTKKEIDKYSREAMMHLVRLQQNRTIPQSLDLAQKQNFIRRYILQAKAKANQALSQGLNALIQQNMNMMGNYSAQQLPPQATGFHLQQQGIPSVQQNMNMTHQNMSASKVNVGMAPANKPAQFNGASNQARAPNAAPMLSFLPQLTDEMKMQLQSVSAEVARSKVSLKDVTMLLSDQEKARVRELAGQLALQFQNVDNIVGYFYVLFGNMDGAKRLMQLKLMTKNIFDGLRQDVYLAGPDLMEKMRFQFQKYADYVREHIIARKKQQQQQQQQQPAMRNNVNAKVNNVNAGTNLHSVNSVNKGQYMPNQQYVQQGMPQLVPGTYANAQNPYQKLLPQHHAPQYARSIPNQAMPLQKSMPSSAPNSRMGSSPMPVPSTVSPLNAKPQAYEAPPIKKAGPTAVANRRKNVKSQSTMPIPASAPTPASLATSIKTPNYMPTPLLPQTQSNKGTPYESSPSQDMRAVADKEPLIGDVFGANTGDFLRAKRCELSKSDPEKFFFSALLNLLEISDDVDHKYDDTHVPVKSPLSPKYLGEWTADVKPFAITSAFRQVDAIWDLTGSDILADFAELARLENEEKPPKRQLEDNKDLELLFVEKKYRKEESAFCSGDVSLAEFDDWKSWLTKLQETPVKEDAG